jgi:hypothetical protein
VNQNRLCTREVLSLEGKTGVDHSPSTPCTKHTQYRGGGKPGDDRSLRGNYQVGQPGKVRGGFLYLQ